MLLIADQREIGTKLVTKLVKIGSQRLLLAVLEFNRLRQPGDLTSECLMQPRQRLFLLRLLLCEHCLELAVLIGQLGNTKLCGINSFKQQLRTGEGSKHAAIPFQKIQTGTKKRPACHSLIHANKRNSSTYLA